MTSVIEDLDRGLNNLLHHVDLQSVRRGSDDIYLANAPLEVLLRLLLERGASSATFTRWRRIIGREEDGIWHYIYSHGAPVAQGAAAPGDLIEWLAGDEIGLGIVIKVDDSGQPTSTAVASGKLLLSDEAIPAESLRTIWTPSEQPRTHDDKAIAEFYGDPSRFFALAEINDRAMGESDIIEYAVGSAPKWIQNRITGAADLDDLKDVLRTLGDGLQTASADSTIPVGSWCFLTRDRIGFSVCTSEIGVPSVLLVAGNTSPVFEHVSPKEITDYWVPNVKPFEYTKEKHAAYDDVNIALGMLRVWGEEKSEVSDLLFLDDDVLDLVSAETRKILRRGPDDETQWEEYLKELGAKESGTPKSGDFLLLDDDLQAIALSEEEMLVRRDYKLGIRRVSRVRLIWRPGA